MDGQATQTACEGLRGAAWFTGGSIRLPGLGDVTVAKALRTDSTCSLRCPRAAKAPGTRRRCGPRVRVRVSHRAHSSHTLTRRAHLEAGHVHVESHLSTPLLPWVTSSVFVTSDPHNLLPDLPPFSCSLHLHHSHPQTLLPCVVCVDRKAPLAPGAAGRCLPAGRLRGNNPSVAGVHSTLPGTSTA